MPIGQFFVNPEISNIQTVGLCISALGILLMVGNFFSKNSEKDVSIDIFGQKINGPRSAIVFLCGIIIFAAPALATKPVDKSTPPSGSSNEIVLKRPIPNDDNLDRFKNQSPQPTEPIQPSPPGSQTAQSSSISSASQNNKQDERVGQVKQSVPTSPQASASTQRIQPDISADQSDLDEVNQIVVTTLGWSYFGSLYTSGWNDKYFEGGSGSNGRPLPGDSLVALADVSIRVAPIEYTISGWRNKMRAGIIKTGDRVNVANVTQVAKGFYWIEIYK